jgi:L-rhamnose isomerase
MACTSNDTGEGMKIGIIALLREHLQVAHYTNKEIWNWCFRPEYDSEGRALEMLTVHLQRYRPRLAKEDQSISQDERDARLIAHRHTTVIVKAQKNRDFGIDFDDYLFLHRPSDDGLMTTKLGSVLTAEQYRSKIYVKEVFMDEHQDKPILRYGINFAEAQLDRDRKTPVSNSKAQETIAKIWNELIERGEGDAAKQYLKVLLEPDDHLETLEAKSWITKPSAQKLFETLRTLQPDCFFFNADEPDPTEVNRVGFVC